MTAIGADYSITSWKDFKRKEPKRGYSDTEKFFSFGKLQRALILADHTLKSHSSIIHAATGYIIWMLQIEHFPPWSKGMHELAAK